MLDFKSKIIFLGVAEKVRQESPSYPVRSIDIFRLTKNPVNIIYPTIYKNYEWVFLIDVSLLREIIQEPISIKIISPNNQDIENFKLSAETTKNLEESNFEVNFLPEFSDWIITNFKLSSTILVPGEYLVHVGKLKKFEKLGNVHFRYAKVLPFGSDQIKAIESNPDSVKAVIVEMGCKKCPYKLKVYSALGRKDDLESEGYIWQHNLADYYECDCHASKIDARYMKESLHGLLLRERLPITGEVSYERLYAHSEIIKVIDAFYALIKKEKNEGPIQKFIEGNPILLARFSASNLFFKTTILGKYEIDFAILDTRKQLLLIELERPDLGLFNKKTGHPSAKLMHAYGQVKDWLNEYSKYPHAVLDKFNLKHSEVTTVRGIVIAGRSINEKPEHLQRNISHPVYPDVEFFTLDDLGESLMEISRKLV